MTQGEGRVVRWEEAGGNTLSLWKRVCMRQNSYKFSTSEVKSNEEGRKVGLKGWGIGVDQRGSDNGGMVQNPRVGYLGRIRGEEKGPSIEYER